MNKVIRRKLMELERSPTNIKQQYKCATNLDRYWKKSRREKKQLRRRESKNQGQKQEKVKNNQRGVRLQLLGIDQPLNQLYLNCVMSSLTLTSGWYYIYTSYYTPDSILLSRHVVPTQKLYKQLHPRVMLSKMKVVDLIYFYFLFYFHFSFDFLFHFLFLELGLGLE